MSFANLLLCHFLLNPFKLFIYFLTKSLSFFCFSFIFPVIVLYFLFFFVFLGMSCFPCSIFSFVFSSIMVLFSFFFLISLFSRFLLAYVSNSCLKTFPMNSYISAWLCICVCVCFLMFLKIHGKVLSHFFLYLLPGRLEWEMATHSSIFA